MSEKVAAKFAVPGNGQSKPMESFWDTINQKINHRFEGRGTKDNPVPIAEFEAAFNEEIEVYNRSLTH